MRALLLAVLLSAAAGCCNHDIAANHALLSLAVNRAHQADEALPVHSRQIAKDNADAWAVQAYLLDPPEGEE